MLKHDLSEDMPMSFINLMSMLIRIIKCIKDLAKSEFHEYYSHMQIRIMTAKVFSLANKID